MTHFQKQQNLCFIDLFFIRQYTDSLIILGMPPNCNTPWMESWLSHDFERKGMWQDGTWCNLGNAFKLHSTSCLITMKMNWNEFKSLLRIWKLLILSLICDSEAVKASITVIFTKQIIKTQICCFWKVSFFCSCCAHSAVKSRMSLIFKKPLPNNPSYIPCLVSTWMICYTGRFDGVL